MMKLALTNFSLRRPWTVIILVLMITGILASQFPKVQFDNDPENMLSADEPVRIFHHQVKEKFNLYDFVVVGVVNDEHPDGVFNVETLGRVHDLTQGLLSLRQTAAGLPAVLAPAADGKGDEPKTLDLSPDSAWKRILGAAFQHDPNELFDAQGRSVIIGRELIAPSVVDNLKQAELGSLKLEYLMENPPATRAEALTIRDDAMSNPLYRGTLVAEDEQALALYIPLTEKRFSYNVANLVRTLTSDWPKSEQVYITGLPVAEDTFGVEMLVQMATSAPLAMLVIFLLLLFFFRRVSLIIAPLLVAMISVICTMGLLIGLGFDVHIMSSMIAIFLMPIAVADSVHILSEFFDAYPRFQDKGKTVRHVIGHLFAPMLYTSLTTIAGFASLGTTPIPPVQIFGLHVAYGVAVAWLLSMTLIPAYIMLAVPEKSLRALAAGSRSKNGRSGPLTRMLGWLGGCGFQRWKLILGVTLAVIGLSAYGISKVQVNDNPVKWFTSDHEIRVADRVLNEHFGGTYTAYLSLAEAETRSDGFAEQAGLLAEKVRERFATRFPESTRRFEAKLKQLARTDADRAWEQLAAAAETLDAEASASWNSLADSINYLDPASLTHRALLLAIAGAEGASEADRQTLTARLQGAGDLRGEVLLERALAICDEFAAQSFQEFVFTMQAELTAPFFKQPETLRYLEGLQAHLRENPVVGKTSSAVDALKKAAYEISFQAAAPGATEQELALLTEANRRNFAVPASAAATGQVFVQLEGMKKKDSLFHLVTRDYREANVWVQLKSGDNKDMEAVVADVKDYLVDNPPPVAFKAEWAGLTYLNVVWQDKMVVGMLTSLASSFLVVLVMMMVLFRSPVFGLLAMIPLSVTIGFIYGLIGLVGKDYDMPVAVLSALTLGLSVDFAIHFLQRAREMVKSLGSWQAASREMFKEPAMAISRNAIIISIGFTPLLVAPLVPYKTVGFFLATIMGVSWLATLFILPALLTLLSKTLFRQDEKTVKSAEVSQRDDRIS
jgi:predicted RND superfamily exporter protein